MVGNIFFFGRYEREGDFTILVIIGGSHKEKFGTSIFCLSCCCLKSLKCEFLVGILWKLVYCPQKLTSVWKAHSDCSQNVSVTVRVEISTRHT